MEEGREQKMREIAGKLEQGVKELFTSEKYTEYLKTMSKFHNYSFSNTVLIALQCPDATLVAGYQTWQKKFNRHVRRGERAIQIIAPVPFKEKQEVKKINPETQKPVLRPDGEPEVEMTEVIIPRFRPVSVFDISQTDGEPLPGLDTPDLTGSVENYAVFMEAVEKTAPVPIRFAMIDGDAKGYYSNSRKEIVIREGMSEIQTMKTAVHEVAHSFLHDRERMEETGEKKDRMTKEVEAESVAFTVCQYFGLDTSDYSFPYIAGWSSDREMRELRSSMDTIRRTAGKFIDDMTDAIRSIQKEKIRKTSEKEEQYQEVEEIPIFRYYAVNDIYGMEEEKEYQFFPTLDAALGVYSVIPNHLDKEVGMESMALPPSRIPLLRCRNGIEEAEDIEAVSWNGKWVMEGNMEALRRVETYLSTHDVEIAYRIDGQGGKYFIIQSATYGYDYTFYDASYREIDGGIYDNFGSSIKEAANEILASEGLSLSDCKVVDFKKLEEKVTEVEQEEIRKVQEKLNESGIRVGERIPALVTNVREVKLEDKEMERTSPGIRFYAAECVASPILGEYLEGLTLREAAEIYKKIPADKKLGKGIGFYPEDGKERNDRFVLMQNGRMQTDYLDSFPRYRDNRLVQAAIAELREIFLEWESEEKVGEEKKPETAMRKEKELPTAIKETGGERLMSVGVGRKEAVLKALRERQERIKAQTREKEGRTTQRPKMGGQEL